MSVQSRFSKRERGRIRPMVRNISINELQPFQDGGVPSPTDPVQKVETDATREYLRSLGILGEDRVIDPGKAQAVFDFFPVTSVQGENIPLREARNLNDPANRAALERLRTTDRTSPFFGKSKSDTRTSYLEGIGSQADLRLQDLLSTANEPENFSRNLLLDEESKFFNPVRASQLSDLEDPLALERADEIFEPRVAELREERSQFFTETSPRRGGGTIRIKPENRGKFTASAKRAGHGVQEHARSVLASDTASPLQKKRANFARNAAKWKKGCGGRFKIK